jgi:hypothetical protein
MIRLLVLLIIILPLADASLGVSPDSLTFDGKNLLQKSITVMNPSEETLFFKVNSDNSGLSFSPIQGVIQPKDKTKVIVNYFSNKSLSEESLIYVMEQNNDENSNLVIGAAVKAIIKGEEKTMKNSANSVYIPQTIKKGKFQLNPVGLMITCSVVLVGLGVYLIRDLRR